MKLLHLLPLAAVAWTFVLPDEQILANIPIEGQVRDNVPYAAGDRGWYAELVSEKDDLAKKFQSHFDDITDEAHDAWKSVQPSFLQTFDEAYERGTEAAEELGQQIHEAAFDMGSWLEHAADETTHAFDRPHKPHHPHHQSNLTVYQLIAGSKYTTKLAKFINEYDDLVKALNSTKANYTIFAPTDSAFEKIPDHAPKPSKAFLKKLLQYHVVPGLYPARRILVSHTAPTLLEIDSLGPEPLPQRIAFKVGFRGLTVNFYSRVRAINIQGTNGVIHAVDSILVPPPNVVKAIELFPGEFSTLTLGLAKTGLLEKLNSTKHAGGTFFAPSNFAFQKLGPRINAFLFSQYGEKYLKALLEYHVVPERTLYSDAYYPGNHDDDDESATSVPKGLLHVDLPTLLKGRELSIDIARYGGFISIKINGFSRVSVQDGIVEDGVLHVVSNVLVPPKRLGGGSENADGAWEEWNGEEMTPEDLMERLSPFLPKSDL